jgi:hypothetical protein
MRPGSTKARVAARLLIVATLAIVLWPDTALRGRMLLRLEVWRADAHLLNVYAAVDDGAAVAQMWDQMGTNPIVAELRDRELESGVAGQRQLDLEGRLRLRLFHRDRLLSEAELQGLQLQRRESDRATWRLAGDDVARAKAAAGV